MGPGDIRSTDQRHHDALEEACRRLLAAGCLPDRAGQPTQLQRHITLDELARGAGSMSAGTSGAGHRAEPAPAFGPSAGPGYDCDAAIAPIVTGQVDHVLLDQLSRLSLAAAKELLLGNAIALLSGPSALPPCPPPTPPPPPPAS